MRNLFLVGILCTSQQAWAGANDLGWLSGHWCGTQGGVFNEEVWLAPRVGSLVGMHRDSKGEKFLGFEYFRIVEEGTALVFWTQPNGKPAVPFRADSVGKNTISFLNPAHDFPKRVTYTRIDATTLKARIDNGTDQGQSMEWTWRDCAKQP